MEGGNLVLMVLVMVVEVVGDLDQVQVKIVGAAQDAVEVEEYLLGDIIGSIGAVEVTA